MNLDISVIIKIIILESLHVFHGSATTSISIDLVSVFPQASAPFRKLVQTQYSSLFMHYIYMILLNSGKK